MTETEELYDLQSDPHDNLGEMWRLRAVDTRYFETNSFAGRPKVACCVTRASAAHHHIVYVTPDLAITRPGRIAPGFNLGDAIIPNRS